MLPRCPFRSGFQIVQGGFTPSILLRPLSIAVGSVANNWQPLRAVASPLSHRRSRDFNSAQTNQGVTPFEGTGTLVTTATLVRHEESRNLIGIRSCDSPLRHAKRNNLNMRITRGKVVDGHIVVKGVTDGRVCCDSIGFR
jgi:hypothetical protein